MPRKIEMFPEVAIAIQLEIYQNHPVLSAQLAKMQTATLEEKVAVIAFYCGVLVDGWFREKELESLFELLLQRLKSKSSIIVLH